MPSGKGRPAGRSLPLHVVVADAVIPVIRAYARLSAITSPASGTLPGPWVTFSENVLERFPAKDLSDRRLLWTMRAVVAGFAVWMTRFALESGSSIFEVVGKAGKVTLATLRPTAED